MIQPLREAFPYDTGRRLLIFDRDAIFSRAVVEFVEAMGTEASRTAFRSPWQLPRAQVRSPDRHPVAERWIGSCRREHMDHVVVLGQRHAVRLVRAYITYHCTHRTHLGLGKDTPDGRAVAPRPSARATVVALPRVGGLRHRYEWSEAA